MNMTIRAAAFNQGQFPTIGFVNLATVPLGVDLAKLVAALAKQLAQDFVPVWGYPAKLYVTQNPKPDEWQVVFMDDADAADALGYHDLTKNGQPISKIFVKTTIAAGEKVSVTASHELMEMLIDPGAQLWAQSDDGKFYAYEMCDACEEEEYQIDGIAVSDFVHPAFFEPWHKPGSAQFDHLKRISRPFQTLKNGYQIVSDGKSSTEIFGSRAKERHFRTVEVRKMHRSEYRKAVMARRAKDRALAVVAPLPPVRSAGLARLEPRLAMQPQPAVAGAAIGGAPIVLEQLGKLLVSVATFTGTAAEAPRAAPPARRIARTRARARKRLLAATAPDTAAPGSTGTSPDNQHYVVLDGSVNVGGDRNWRNNNPGNIEYGPFAQDNGAIGSDGRFAIFPDEQTGRDALTTLLNDKYGEQTISDMMQSYAPPSENDTDNYVTFIENQTGLSGDDVVGDLTEDQLNALADAIDTMEGGHAGDTYEAGGSDNPDWVDGVIGTGSGAGDNGGDDTGDDSGDDTGSSAAGSDNGDGSSDGADTGDGSNPNGNDSGDAGTGASASGNGGDAGNGGDGGTAGDGGANAGASGDNGGGTDAGGGDAGGDSGGANAGGGNAGGGNAGGGDPGGGDGGDRGGDAGDGGDRGGDGGDRGGDDGGDRGGGDREMHVRAARVPPPTTPRRAPAMRRT
jgi:hypothetical protein